jgi:hypothetical protein
MMDIPAQGKPALGWRAALPSLDDGLFATTRSSTFHSPGTKS